MEIISKEEQIMYENLITGSNGGINVKKIPLLTKDQVKELVELRDHGYNEAITKLVLHNLGLIKKVATQFVGENHRYDDLFQEGVIGLIEAANKYDITKKASFSTYAYYWIYQKISIYAYEERGVIRASSWNMGKERKIKCIQTEFYNEFKREPTIEEISQISGIDYDKISLIIQCHQKTMDLDGEVAGGAWSLVETIPNENSSNPEDIAKKLDFQVANEVLKLLTPREREIFELRFGFKTGYELNKAEVARFLNLSYQYIQQRETKAIKKIRKSEYGKELIEKLDGYCDILGCIEEKMNRDDCPKRPIKSRADVLVYFAGEDERDVREAINNLTPGAKEAFFKYYDYSLKRRPNQQLSKKELQYVNNALMSIRRRLEKNSNNRQEKEQEHQKTKVISK